MKPLQIEIGEGECGKFPLTFSRELTAIEKATMNVCFGFVGCENGQYHITAQSETFALYLMSVVSRKLAKIS